MSRQPAEGPAAPEGAALAPAKTAPALPLVVEPSDRGADAVEWATAHRDGLHARILLHGGILLRGFAAGGADHLERLAGALGGPLMDYTDRVTRRTPVRGRVLTATDTPARFAIPLHNENAFASAWPRHVFFACVRPASQGGCTPLADVRRVYQRIDPAVRRPFEARGVMVARRFGAGPGMSWQEAFPVADRDELEQYLHGAEVSYAWLPDGGLRTWQVRPATARHPRTGEWVWFNHAVTLHVTSQEPTLRDTLLAQLGEKDLPHNTYYGDGSPIDPEVLDHLRRAYDAHTVRFDWQPGDVLILDNLLVAHGRDPYRGERQVLTALAGATSWEEAEAGGTANTPESWKTKPRPPQGGRPSTGGPTVQELAALVAEVLERGTVGPGDNFLDLGGDSILAAGLVTRARDRLGIEIPLADLFDAPTVADLAARLAKGKEEPPGVGRGPEMERLAAELRQLPEETLRELLRRVEDR